MKYAIFICNGKQYKAVEGETLLVERIDEKPESSVNFDKVLLYVADGKTQIGTPYIDGLLIKGKLIEEEKGEKIRVSKFKSKVRYRRVTGHRSIFSKVKIEEIYQKEEKKEEAKKTDKPKTPRRKTAEKKENKT